MSDPIFLDPLSYASYYVEQLYQGQVMGTATCFFVKRHDTTYLITNWHVVTGKHPRTLAIEHPQGVCPDQMKVEVFKDQDNVERADFFVDLYAKGGTPLWREHPIHRQNVDVVAIEVVIPDGLAISYVEDCIEPFNEKTQAGIADDVFVVGYPFGLSVADKFPIWKRASVASEPILDAEGLPLIYVDTATRSGMSGSPVVYRQRRGISVINKEKQHFSRFFMSFVGVYSGRIGENKDFTVQLGKVWKASVIDEIIV